MFGLTCFCFFEVGSINFTQILFVDVYVFGIKVLIHIGFLIYKSLSFRFSDIERRMEVREICGNLDDKGKYLCKFKRLLTGIKM